MRKILNSLCLLLLISTAAMAQQVMLLDPMQEEKLAQTEQDKINLPIYEQVFSAVEKQASLPMHHLVVEIALQFLGTPYEASTLEKTPEELHVFLDRTDCILFVELCSAFALTVKGLRIVQAGDGKEFYVNPKPSVELAQPSYELLCENIQNMRYRLGKVDEYASRIHYTSEWILQNQTNGLMREYTKDLGEEYTQKFYFMSSHPKQYFQLADDPKQLAMIEEVEQHLSEQEPFYFISHERLQERDVIDQLQNGDIVCFMSKQGNGIDIAHVAIAYDMDGEMHFIHASYGAKEVKIEETLLADYATNGIRIVRFNEVLDDM